VIEIADVIEFNLVLKLKAIYSFYSLHIVSYQIKKKLIPALFNLQSFDLSTKHLS